MRLKPSITVGLALLSAFILVVIIAVSLRSHLKYQTQIADLRSSNVDEDVSSALSRNDTRFVAIQGQALMVPGLDYFGKLDSDGRLLSPEKAKMENRFALRQQYGYRVIEGTGDVIDSDDQSELQHLAFEYAWEYNTQRLAELNITLEGFAYK